MPRKFSLHEAETRTWKQALGSHVRQTGKALSGKRPGVVQDLKILRRTSKALTSPKQNVRYGQYANMVASGVLGAGQREKLKGKIANRVSAETKLQGVRRGAQYRLARKAAIGALGLAAAYGGAKAIKKFRKRNDINNPKFRQYDVYPEHQYGVAPVQRVNRPYYPNDEFEQGGPPRLRESERESIIHSLIITLTS